MNSLRLMSWNVEGRLTHAEEDEGRSAPHAIAAEVLRQQPDVAYVAESTRSESLSDELRARFEEAGYTILECEYDEPDRIVKESGVATHSILLCRVPVESSEVLRYGEQRQLPVARIRYQSSTITIAGVHLDDRAEDSRVAQAYDIAREFADEKYLVCLGDFNAMAKHGRSRILRSRLARLAARSIPHAFVRSAAVRATDMAEGKTLEILTEKLALQDADEKHRPTATPKLRGYTWLPSVRLIQIDHILLSKSINATNFEVLPDGGSDHRAIVCDITLDKTEKI